MATIYRDEDCPLTPLQGKVVAILGYGNQGRSQALNLRDSGVSVVVGGPSDASTSRATADGLEAGTIAEATARADIVFVLVPDEVIPEVFADQIAPHLKPEALVNFASGYTVTYGLVSVPDGRDITLLGPRMIGKGVRDTFVDGTGFPSLIAVERDATGNAWDLVKALAHGIGSTAMGAVVTTFREETIVDLFAEQSGEFVIFQAMFESLTEAGVDPDVALLEMYASGELSEIYAEARDMGLLAQMKLHSHTSQYGQQVVSPRHTDKDAVKAGFRAILDDLKSGAFVKEYTEQYNRGLPALYDAVESGRRHPMQQAEDRLYAALGRRTAAVENWLPKPSGQSA